MSKKILISLLLTLFAFVSLASSTFAWFGFAKSNVVDGIEMNVITDGQLYISLDGINFSQAITSTQIQELIGYNVELTDVTTTDQTEFISGLFDSKNAIVNSDYISFDLWFRTEKLSKKSVFLVNNTNYLYSYDVALNYPIEGTFAFSEGVNWTTGHPFQNGSDVYVKEGKRDTYYACNALRIGIVEQPVEEKLLGKVDERVELQSLIYDISENKERGYGSPYGALSYFKSVYRNELTPPKEQPNTIYNLTTFKNPYEAYNNDSQIASFQSSVILDSDNKIYHYAKVKVNIWIEGWDADCFDSILEDNVIVQLMFRSANPTI